MFGSSAITYRCGGIKRPDAAATGPEESALEAQLIERFAGYDEALLDLARTMTLEISEGYPGPLFWNELASDLLDDLVARHTSEFASRAPGVLGRDLFERLRDYVVAHLDEPIEVATLAN